MRKNEYIKKVLSDNPNKKIGNRIVLLRFDVNELKEHTDDLAKLAKLHEFQIDTLTERFL